MDRVAPEKMVSDPSFQFAFLSRSLSEKKMPKIFTDGKKKQMVYIYNNALGGCISVELSHPVLENTFTHCNLTIEQFEKFTSDCQNLLASAKAIN